MANEATELVESPWRRALFSAELYKRSQGKLTRQATFGALALVTALGCWSLNAQLTFSGLDQSARYGIVQLHGRQRKAIASASGDQYFSAGEEGCRVRVSRIGK